MIYGYARVSTKGQAKDGNSLEAQEKALREHGATKIYADSFTGTKKHRPQLDLLLAQLHDGDTLIVTKLDRMARSTIQGCELVGQLLGMGVIVHVLNMGVLDNSTTGKLIRTILFAFAEFERDCIVERTREGKEIARTRSDYKEGRKPVDVDSNLFQECQEAQKVGTLTVKECCERLNISRSTWYNLVRRSVA